MRLGLKNLGLGEFGAENAEARRVAETAFVGLGVWITVVMAPGPAGWGSYCCLKQGLKML